MAASLPLRSFVLLTPFAAACATTSLPPPAKPVTKPVAADVFHDLLVDTKTCDTPTPDTVPRADLEADLPVIVRVMRRGWAGLGVREKQGLDLDRLLASARAGLRSLPESISSGDAAHWLAHAFRAARDGHLAFFAIDAKGRWHYGSTGVHADAYASAVRLTPAKDGWRVVESSRDGPTRGDAFVACAEPAAKLRPTLLGLAPKLDGLLVVTADRPPAPLHCRFRDAQGAERVVALPLHRVVIDRSPRQPAAFTEVDGTVPVLRVESFADAYRDDLLRFVATAPALRDRQAVVLDLRGNQGGSDTFALDWMKGLTSGPLAYHAIDAMQSEVTLQGDVNWATCELADRHLGPAARKRFTAMRGDYEHALAHAAAKVGHPFKHWRRWTPVEHGKAPAPFAGTLVLLVDSRCASACESMVMYARQLPGTVVVGENTEGAGVFGESRRYYLPHTGLWMQAGEKWFHSGAPSVASAREGAGYLPDLWLDGVPALGAANDVARCLADAECRTALRRNLAAAGTGRGS